MVSIKNIFKFKKNEQGSDILLFSSLGSGLMVSCTLIWSIVSLFLPVTVPPDPIESDKAAASPVSEAGVSQASSMPMAIQTPLTLPSNTLTEPSPSSESTANDNKALIHSQVNLWQEIKRQAFVNGDTSSLSTVLTGKALTDTEGGVSWWRTNGQYHDITLNSLDFLDTQITGTSASVRVRISETKNNSVEGRKTSTYNATYGLEKRGENWYISSVAAD